jgi:hypothetical protein
VLLISGAHLGPVEASWMFVNGALNVAYFIFLQRGYRAGDLSIVYPLARGTGPVLATIGAILGGGGLGRFIFDGLSQGDVGTPSIYCGAILVSGLAIGVDLILAWAQNRLTPRALRRTRRRRSSGPPSVAGRPDIATAAPRAAA